MPPRILRMTFCVHSLVSGGCDIILPVKYGTIARQKRLLGNRADTRPAWQGTTEPASPGITRLINVGNRPEVGINNFNPKPTGRNDLGCCKGKSSWQQARMPPPSPVTGLGSRLWTGSVMSGAFTRSGRRGTAPDFGSPKSWFAN